MSKSMILLITIFSLWVFLILYKKDGQMEKDLTISAGVRG